MKNVIEYKGYYSKVEYDSEERVLYGKIEGINDLVNFECESTSEVETAFHEAVDDYLQFCADNGVAPETAFKGVINVRLNPVRHRNAAVEAAKEGISLSEANDIIWDHKLNTLPIVDKKGNIIGAYRFLNNGHEIFDKFMGALNPFTLINDKETKSDDIPSVFGSAFGGQNYSKIEKLSPININLECTLEELYSGCVKTVKYKKQKLNYDLRTTNIEEVTQDVAIFKGYDSSTVITFKEKGNDSPGYVSSDLNVYIKELPHNVFKRINKNDLLYIHDITLVKALNSEPVCLYTLDGRRLAISIDEIIAPNTVKIVKGEGMPIYDKDLAKTRGDKIQKGDLYIKFNIIFPEFIVESKKRRIIELLKSEEE